MKQLHIVLASVLKPVNDVRMHDKLALTLRNTLNARISLIGQPGVIEKKEVGIDFFPVFKFDRLAFIRLISNFIFLKYLFRLQPDIIIVTTFELLPATIIYKLFKKKTALFYDVQENYYLNILYLNVHPHWLRWPLAGVVRTIEYAARPFIKGYFLAEACYSTQLPFIKQKNWVQLENKFQPPIGASKKFIGQKEKIRFLIYGTLSESYGLFEAIAWVKKLNTTDKRFELIICGRISKSSELEKLRESIIGHPYIQLITKGHQSMTYHEIIEQLQKADAVLMPYPINQAIAERIPTKFYECLYYKVPIVVSQNPVWESFFKSFPFRAALFTDFTSSNFKQIFLKEKFYQSVNEDYFKEILWMYEAAKLKNFMNKLGYSSSPSSSERQV